MLARHGHLVLFSVPPTMSAFFRRAFCPSGAKDDPADAAMLLDLLIGHRDQLRRYEPDDEKTRLLQLLVEERRQTVDDKTRVVLRLTDCLKQYFPHVLRWFGSVDSLLVADLLDQWPDLQSLQSVNPAKLAKFFREHHCHDEDRIQERIQQIYAAVPATSDAAVVEARRRRAVGLVSLLRPLWKFISQLEARIHELVTAHPDASIFRSFPGAGAATVPRLIAALGTRRDRFQTAYQLQCYSGIAPVQKASGKTRAVHFRFACPKFLRQTFHEFAAQSVPHCAWAKAFYQQQRSRGNSHHAAVRALAYKWIRILFRCWKDRVPYDDQRYVNSPRRRTALLGTTISQATAAKWTNVAGVNRLSGDLA
jgi:transposase